MRVRLFVALGLLLCLSISGSSAQKISEEDALEGSAIYQNPDDEDSTFESSGLPPDVHEEVKQPTTPKFITDGHKEVVPEKPVEPEKPVVPPQPVPGDSKPEESAESGQMMIIIAIAVIVGILVLLALIICCCRKSKNAEYTRGTPSDKMNV